MAYQHDEPIYQAPPKYLHQSDFIPHFKYKAKSELEAKNRRALRNGYT